MNLISAENLPLPIKITSSIRDKAFDLASLMPRGIKREKVFFNTIAICVLNDYLQWMSVPTDLEGSNSLNPACCLCSDAADLEISSVGALECCVFKENEDFYFVPPEAWENRIGYVGIELKSSFFEALLLGFYPAHKAGILHRQDLYPIESLFNFISNSNFLYSH